ncbi:RICIN domain-containing protein [Natrialba asiatica]|uniref:Ricin B lectin n=1 Tax=Natrialba asiatica (strain ATCC 700177 / DSM 12278 / JCM 9576 / FERM P-10747 / NBRC 102637 / 172P1) TaxID=29540 RepID=M0B5S5_NATA1|nr:RICIN domain-containing protein [Natrialba asiatica]ELZ06160.1 Ricin B lectin [Natrialba asiatica DSM 12278]
MSNGDSSQNGTHGSERETNGRISMGRRGAMTALGAVGLGATLTGAVSARESARTDGRDGLGTQPWYEWEADVTASGHRLTDLDALDVAHTHTNSRDAAVVVWRDDDGVYHADDRGGTVASDGEPMAVLQAALDALDADRRTKATVQIATDLTVSDSHDVTGVDVPSHTRLAIAGAVTVEGETGDLFLVEGVENVEFTRLVVRGPASRAIFADDCSDLTIGRLWIDGVTVQGVRLQGGCTDVQIDTAYVANTGHHGIETYDVERIQIGQVTGVDPGSSVVLLNETVDATVGQVVGRNPSFDYATFRLANGCRNVSVGRVISRGGVRGLSIITGTRDVTVGSVLIQGGRKAGILLVDVKNVKILGGVIKNTDGPGVNFWSIGLMGESSEINEGVTLANLRITDDRDEPRQPWAIDEDGACLHNQFINNDVRGGGTEGRIKTASETTVVRGNVGGGLDRGTVTLESGGSPAARVAGVSEHYRSTPEARTAPYDEASAAAAWEQYPAWNAETGQWDLVFEWRTDPGTDIDVDYVVDRPRAAIGREIDRDSLWEEAVQSIEPGTYRIVAEHSGKVLEVADGSTATGAAIQQGEFADDPHQRWVVDGEMEGRQGWFTLAAEHSGKGIVFSGTDAVQGSVAEYRAERYESGFQVDVPGGRLEVADAALDSGAPVRAGPWRGASHQIWSFDRL